jgi:hypothetical protein
MKGPVLCATLLLLLLVLACCIQQQTDRAGIIAVEGL